MGKYTLVCAGGMQISGDSLTGVCAGWAKYRHLHMDYASTAIVSILGSDDTGPGNHSNADLLEALQEVYEDGLATNMERWRNKAGAAIQKAAQVAQGPGNYLADLAAQRQALTDLADKLAGQVMAWDILPTSRAGVRDQFLSILAEAEAPGGPCTFCGGDHWRPDCPAIAEVNGQPTLEAKPQATHQGSFKPIARNRDYTGDGRADSV